MGGGQFLDFMGDTAVMRGGIELMGVPPSPPLGKTLMCHTTRLTKFVTSRPIVNIRKFW